MSRYVVVDYADHHAVVDTERDGAGQDDGADLGEVVWRGEPHDRKDLDAQWASARAAEVEANTRNNSSPADRPRPTEPPPSIELTLDSASSEAAAHGAEA